MSEVSEMAQKKVYQATTMTDRGYSRMRYWTLSTSTRQKVRIMNEARGYVIYGLYAG